MKDPIQSIAVVGSGVMGAAIAAQFANAGYPVSLLDRVPQELNRQEAEQRLDLNSPVVRNRIVKTGLERISTTKPPALFLPEFAERIRPGNLEDHASWLPEADWIIEAVTENIEVKKEVLKRIDRFRSQGTVVSTNTSGISVNLLAKGLSEDMRLHWLGTHFFNPPRYMKLLELVPTEETLPRVVEAVTTLCDRRLGKGIILVKDTPNFIANRIGTFAIQMAIELMQKYDLRIDEVDQLTGTLIGRPKSATFRTLDLIGLDTYAHVTLNIHQNALQDEDREVFKVPALVQALLERQWLGDKTRQGFYKKLKSQEILTLDPASMDYLQHKETRLALLETAKGHARLIDRFNFLLQSIEPAGKFLWELLNRTLVYAARRVPEISDCVADVDDAMKWGFNWELGPFETWDSLGAETLTARIAAEGGTVPTLVREVLSTPEKAFYRLEKGRRRAISLPSLKYEDVPEPAGLLWIGRLREAGQVIRESLTAGLVDLGDGVACIEFHSKMNTLDGDLLNFMEESLQIIQEHHQGVVIGNQGQNFSAGANLKLILKAALEKDWTGIERLIRGFQQVNLHIKYAARPVVVAPFGLTLGGGCEIALHSPHLQASAETYMGLVELAVGLIPAAGGSKEMVLRSLVKSALSPDGDAVPFLQQAFETIALGKVSGSAAEARKLGFLRETDRISMNRDRLIADAKERVIQLAREGYQKPLPARNLVALGSRALAPLKLTLDWMRKADRISDYDFHLGSRLAYVLCGGDSNLPQPASETYFLDLERETFLSLCGEARTQARIQYMLENGKPLRN